MSINGDFQRSWMLGNSTSMHRTSVLEPIRLAKRIMTTNPTSPISNPAIIPQPPRGFAAVKSRPLLHLLSFGILHQSIAWLALPPIFYFFQITGAATTLLAGPQVAWILSRPVPRWLPIPFVDRKEATRLGSSEGEPEAVKRKSDAKVA